MVDASDRNGRAIGRIEGLLEMLVRQNERVIAIVEQQVRMLDDDRKDTASFRGRTREQLLELIEKSNATNGSIAKIAPTVDDLERDRQQKELDAAVAAAEKRGAGRVKALVITIAGGVGAAAWAAFTEVLKLWNIWHPK